MEDSLNKVNRKIDMSFGELKTCTKCECVKKRAKDFSFDVTRKDGLATWCKPCSNAYYKGRETRAMTPQVYKAWRINQCQEKIKFWTDELSLAQKGVKTRNFRQPETNNNLPMGLTQQNG